MRQNLADVHVDSQAGHFRFSLRSIFFLLLLCAIFFAYQKSQGAGVIHALAVGFALMVTGTFLWWITAKAATSPQRIGRWHSLAHAAILAGGCFGAVVGWPIGILFGVAAAAVAQIPVGLMLAPLDGYTDRCLSNQWLGVVWGGLSGFVAALIMASFEVTWQIVPAAVAFGAIYTACAGRLRDRCLAEGSVVRQRA